MALEYLAKRTLTDFFLNFVPVTYMIFSLTNIFVLVVIKATVFWSVWSQDGMLETSWGRPRGTGARATTTPQTTARARRRPCSSSGKRPYRDINRAFDTGTFLQ